VESIGIVVLVGTLSGRHVRSSWGHTGVNMWPNASHSRNQSRYV